jgi:hypothetical protein
MAGDFNDIMAVYKDAHFSTNLIVVTTTMTAPTLTTFNKQIIRGRSIATAVATETASILADNNFL